MANGILKLFAGFVITFGGMDIQEESYDERKKKKEDLQAM